VRSEDGGRERGVCKVARLMSRSYICLCSVEDCILTVYCIRGLISNDAVDAVDTAVLCLLPWYRTAIHIYHARYPDLSHPRG
jgi:hypothetical protein